MESNVDLGSVARNYLKAIERGATGEELARFFTEDVIQEEFPNRLTPEGARRRLDEILLAAERGRQVLSVQEYRVENQLVAGSQVSMEVAWTGTVKLPVASLMPGDSMSARFCVVLEFEGDRISRQRNYDCFEPF
jgi:ketosteroid isomerase-like protein